MTATEISTGGYLFVEGSHLGGVAAQQDVPEERFLGSKTGHGLSPKADRIVSADLYVLPYLVGLSGEDKQLIMNDHDGPGVVPGRYAGEAIRLHDGPTPQQVAYQQQRVQADGLAGRICAAAAETARSQYLLLELLSEFDAIGGIRHWSGFKSFADWLSWSCSMTPGVAREHVRVARVLRKCRR